MESYIPSKFDSFREKVFPSKWVDVGMAFGIAFIIIGLILQISYFSF